MTPDTPHWRSGARQIGLFSFLFFSFLASSPMSIPKIRSAVQGTANCRHRRTVRRKLSSRLRETSWRQTDGRDPSRSSSAWLPSPRSIEHPIASRPDDPSRPFMIYPARPIRRGSGSGPVLLSLIELGPLDGDPCETWTLGGGVGAHCPDATGARQVCKLCRRDGQAHVRECEGEISRSPSSSQVPAVCRARDLTTRRPMILARSSLSMVARFQPAAPHSSHLPSCLRTNWSYPTKLHDIARIARVARWLSGRGQASVAAATLVRAEARDTTTAHLPTAISRASNPPPPPPGRNPNQPHAVFGRRGRRRNEGDCPLFWKSHESGLGSWGSLERFQVTG